MSGNAKISKRTNTPAAIQKQVPPLLQIQCHRISRETEERTNPVPSVSEFGATGFFYGNHDVD
jgi:hypothetical protein